MSDATDIRAAIEESKAFARRANREYPGREAHAEAAIAEYDRALALLDELEAEPDSQTADEAVISYQRFKAVEEAICKAALLSIGPLEPHLDANRRSLLP